MLPFHRRTAPGLLLLVLAAPAAGGQRLSDFRRVVVPDQPGRVEKAAAEELAHYVGRITGQAPGTIRWSDYRAEADGLSFFVGADVAERVLGEKLGPWADEEWVLRTVPRGLVLAGRDGDGDPWSARTPAGTLLAVYTLLDDYLGVHWFWPGAFGEHVPHDQDAVVPELRLRRAPAFAIRSVSLGYPAYHTATFAEAARRWARRSRLAWSRPA